MLRDRGVAMANIVIALRGDGHRGGREPQADSPTQWTAAAKSLDY